MSQRLLTIDGKPVRQDGKLLTVAPGAAGQCPCCQDFDCCGPRTIYHLTEPMCIADHPEMSWKWSWWGNGQLSPNSTTFRTIEHTCGGTQWHVVERVNGTWRWFRVVYNGSNQSMDVHEDTARASFETKEDAEAAGPPTGVYSVRKFGGVDLDGMDHVSTTYAGGNFESEKEVFWELGHTVHLLEIEFGAGCEWDPVLEQCVHG